MYESESLGSFCAIDRGPMEWEARQLLALSVSVYVIVCLTALLQSALLPPLSLDEFLGMTTYVGFAMQAAHVWWARKKVYRAEDLVVFAIGSMGFARLAMGGLLGPIQYGFVGLPLLYLCVRLGQWVLRALHLRARALTTSP